jgi:hypothetical protein
VIQNGIKDFPTAFGEVGQTSSILGNMTKIPKTRPPPATNPMRKTPIFRRALATTDAMMDDPTQIAISSSQLIVGAKSRTRVREKKGPRKAPNTIKTYVINACPKKAIESEKAKRMVPNTALVNEYMTFPVPRYAS